MDIEQPDVDLLNQTILELTHAPYDLADGTSMSPVTLTSLTNGTEYTTSYTSTVMTLQVGHTIVTGILLGLLIVITLLGNGLVITAVASFRRLRSVTNYFVVSLAVADITVATLVMPYALVYEIFAEWRFGWVFCCFWISCDVTCCTASILHLCIIALDRYLAITQPFSYHNKMSKKRALLMIAGVWICSTAISFLPVYLGWFIDSSKRQDLYVDSPNCGLYVNQIYAVISSSTSFYIPLLVMIFAYVKIFRIARKQATEIRRLESSIAPHHLLLTNGNNGSRGDVNIDKVRKRCKRVQRDSKAVKTLGTLMGLFCVSWLPFFLMYVIVPFCDSCDVPPLVVSAITWLGYLNSAINPCVYAFLSRDFRVAFKRILSCGGKCNQRKSRSRYQSACCDVHPDSACHCEIRLANRRHSSSSSGGRTPSLLSRDRLKLEVRKGTLPKENGYKLSKAQDKRYVTEQESPITEALEFRDQGPVTRDPHVTRAI